LDVPDEAVRFETYSNRREQMSKAEHNADPVDPVAERYARLEAMQRRAAEHGITIHIPARDAGEWQPPEVLFPVSADEVSAMVVRLRRGDL
jgi:hypothetical protein